ncbi:MAG: NUDIX hydrolase [Acutalibacteraceae bacterium]
MLNTTLIYIENDGKYLMLHRVKKKHDINHDKWIGVGGKCEENESPEECAVREAYEETGLTLLHPQYRGVVTFVCDGVEGEYMHLFTCTEFSGTLRECQEGDLQWIDKNIVPTLPTWEGDRIFLEKIAQPSPFFSLKLVYQGNRLISKDCHTYGAAIGS